jgi:hypothetical protein
MHFAYNYWHLNEFQSTGIKRDSAARFSTSGFLHASVSPKPQIIPLRPFQIFSNLFAAHDTGWKWKKSLFRKVFIISFGHLWVVGLEYSLIFFPLFSTCVVDTSGKFATGINNTSGLLLILVVHLDLRKSQQILKSFEMSVIFRAWGKMIHGKNLKQKISWHCPCYNSLTRSIIFRGPKT